jgi:Tol biopolymer transport system component
MNYKLSIILLKQSGLIPRLLMRKFLGWGINPRPKNGLLPPVGERPALSEVEGIRTTASCLLPSLILCSTLLTGCFGYPRLLSYPFDPGGRSLNSSASELNPQISGRYIIFTSDRRGSQDVYMFDTLTRNLVDLPGLNSFDTIASHPGASENGKFIVFAASRQGRTQIVFYDRDVRQSRNLAGDLQGEVRNPTISADGSRIAFEYNNNGQWDILVYDRFGRKLNIPQDPS